MVIGLLHGRERPDDDQAKETTYRLAEEFIDRFAAQNGSRICRDLIGFDPATTAGRRRFREDPELIERCAGIVREAAALLEEILAANPPGQR